MKKRFFPIFLLITLSISAQKKVHDDNPVTRSAKEYHAIEISAGIDLYLLQGTEEGVTVSGATNEYRDKIQVEVVKGVLKIYYEKQNSWGMNWGNKKLKAYVSVKNLDKLTASGGSDVILENELNIPELSLNISGGADFKGKLITKELFLTAHGGSDAYLSGKTEKINIKASGGSDIHGYEMIANYCQVETRGGSDVRITVNNQITGQVTGGSDIYYKGAANSSVTKSGGGSIKKTN